MNSTKFVFSTVIKILITIVELVFFGIVLYTYYGPILFDNVQSIGYPVTLLLFLIVYLALANLFRAFKIIDFSIMDTVFSQAIALAITDFLLFCEICLIGRGYLSVLPGLLTFACQFVFAVIWGLLSKIVACKYLKPEKTLIITGVDDTQEFTDKLSILSSIFKVEKIVKIDDIPVSYHELLSPYGAVIFYEVDSYKRFDLLWYCIQNRKSLYLTPHINEITFSGFSARHLIDTPMVKYEYRSERFWYNFFKRIIDIVVSFIALIILSPFFLITAIAIKTEDHGPVLYKQKRCTKNGKVFNILKFRSMIVNAEKDGVSIPCRAGDPRITKVGRIIRKCRIDEFPQIINVLKGDMSLVGPRPERIEHVQEFTKEIPEFAYRLRVKGGLTGYAQIYGKYNTSPYDKLRMDLQYIENQSLLTDLKLLLLTIKIIFVAESTEGFTDEKSAQVTQKVQSHQVTSQENSQ